MSRVVVTVAMVVGKMVELLRPLRSQWTVLAISFIFRIFLTIGLLVGSTYSALEHAFDLTHFCCKTHVAS